MVLFGGHWYVLLSLCVSRPSDFVEGGVEHAWREVCGPFVSYAALWFGGARPRRRLWLIVVQKKVAWPSACNIVCRVIRFKLWVAADGCFLKRGLVDDNVVRSSGMCAAFVASGRWCMEV